MPGKRKIINDPVFGFIAIPNDFLFDLLQHEYVQRLSRIRQMGLSYFVYPGATHTRFLHSLGAMHLMHEAVTALRMKGIDISHNEGVDAMAAILLHDIGHGPFSHVLENTLVKNIAHEDISLLMMKKINSEMNGRLQGGIDIFTDRYPRHFLHQLISSQLDVDRIDYLCRDAFFCGVTEGTVASERILKMLNVRNDELVVEAKGIYSVEKYLVARRLMYWQVYLHKTSVAAEQMLINILHRAKQLCLNGENLFCSPALRFFLYQDIDAKSFSSGNALQQYSMLDDSDILTAIKVWATSGDIVLSTLCKAFCNRKLFKVQELTVPLTKEDKMQLLSKYAEYFKCSTGEAQMFFSEHSSTKDMYSKKDDSISILTRDGQIKDIAQASDMLNLQVLTKHVEKHYLFYYEI